MALVFQKFEIKYTEEFNMTKLEKNFYLMKLKALEFRKRNE